MDSTIIAVVVLYFTVALALGFWVARKERNVADDYFLAGRKLPWYAISLSMTGSNIGTEHFIGMVGTAYVFGLAPATFEWGNFIPYSILIWICLPFFFRKKLYTIPEFLERRYNGTTRTTFVVVTLLYMIVGVLIPALYVGGRVVYEMALDKPLVAIDLPFVGFVALISAATAAYCIYGGLLSVVWTDVLQVTILTIGGVLLVCVGVYQTDGLDAVWRKNAESVVRQVDAETIVTRRAEEVKGTPEEDLYSSRTSLLLSADHPVSPWTGVATFWFTVSLCYVTTSQFYIQRCLGARSEWDAKMGVIGCAFLKIFLPFIIVFPGMVAFAHFGPIDVSGLARDAVYVTMVKTFFAADGALGILGPVIQGLLLSALLAALMSSVSSILNSSSTIWAIDVHKRLLRPNASERELVSVGRWSTFVIILAATVVAPMLLWWDSGVFIFIQSIYALFGPPIVVIFMTAFLWRRAHARPATFTLFFGVGLGALLWAFSAICTVDRMDAYCSGLGPTIIEPLTTTARWLSPMLNRAAAGTIICLVAMVVASIVTKPASGETYDPDTIWNLRWARLPEEERRLNRGPRNLMFWWMMMIVASASLFIFFR